MRRPGPRWPRDGHGGEGERRERHFVGFSAAWFLLFSPLLPPGRRGVGAPVLTALFFTFFVFYRKAGGVWCQAGRGCWVCG